MISCSAKEKRVQATLSLLTLSRVSLPHNAAVTFYALNNFLQLIMQKTWT